MVLIITGSCTRSSLEPVEIELNEPCTFCHMAISERNFAAEIVRRNGRVHKFDDIGCMINYALEQKVRPNPDVAFYVTDYNSLNWIPAAQAVYVHSDQLRTPMASGLAAFRDRAAAEKFLEEFPGKLASFSDLWDLVAQTGPARHRPEPGNQEQ